MRSTGYRRSWVGRGAVAAGLAVVLLGTGTARAVVPPLKSLDALSREVMAFLVSDVGDGGIRHDDNDPEKPLVPPYFYHYGIRNNDSLWTCGEGYPGYCSVSYPGYTSSVAIDAFLDMRRYTGDPEMLARARQFADWILEHRTPASDLYGNLPYSTQTNGVMGGGWDGPAIMTDKPAMFAVRLLRLYDITGVSDYWQAALQIADVLVATQLTGGVEDDGRWPFRVVPADGTVTQDYTSDLVPAVRLFDTLAQRTADPRYAAARDRAWQWLQRNPCNPASPSYQRWEAFYEDQDPDMQTGMRDHYSANEMIIELARRRPAGWQDMAIAILDTATARFLSAGPDSPTTPYEPVTLEWQGWPQATYAATLQYAEASLVLWRALAGDPRQDDLWRTRALQMVDVCTHGQNTRGIAADGRMYTTIRDILYIYAIDSWYEQNFNTVKYALAIMAQEPDRAPWGETHVLAADHALTTIAYGGDDGSVTYATAGGGGRETLRLAAPPLAVLAGGTALPPLPDPDDAGPGYYFDPSRRLLVVAHASSPVQVVVDVLAQTPPAPAELRLERPAPNPFNPRTSIAFTLATPGSCRLAVYGLDGRRVRTLLAGACSAGRHVVSWDGRDDGGKPVASGAYLVRVTAAGAVAERTVTLIK